MLLPSERLIKALSKSPFREPFSELWGPLQDTLLQGSFQNLLLREPFLEAKSRMKFLACTLLESAVCESFTSACNRGKPLQREKECLKNTSILVPAALADPDRPLKTPL